MGLDFVKKAFPALGIVGAIGDFLVAILSGYCLWQLRDLTDRYRIAGLGLMGLTVFNVFYELLQSNNNMRVIGFVFGVIAVGFGIVCKYNEIHAHSEMLAGIHDELAQKWLKLWKWIVALYAAIFGSIVLIFIPFLDKHTNYRTVYNANFRCIFRVVSFGRQARNSSWYAYPRAYCN